MKKQDKHLNELFEAMLAQKLNREWEGLFIDTTDHHDLITQVNHYINQNTKNKLLDIFNNCDVPFEESVINQVCDYFYEGMANMPYTEKVDCLFDIAQQNYQNHILIQSNSLGIHNLNDTKQYIEELSSKVQQYEQMSKNNNFYTFVKTNCQTGQDIQKLFKNKQDSQAIMNTIHSEQDNLLQDNMINNYPKI